ncbi:MAG: hypothetical protein EBX41_04105, partial [Chitinophagia bacterium]|nr:hypothetical protein [Chitinophagia bacterium]
MINLAHLLPDKHGIPVLMYHKVMLSTEDYLTVNPHTLARQWQWLQEEGYKAIALDEYLQLIQKPLPALPYKPLLITFDDGYYNNYEYAYPLLQKMGWCATIFVITRTLTTDRTTEADTDKLTVADYHKMDSATIQLALHGYHHEHFSQLTPLQVSDITDKCLQAFEQVQLPYYKVLAYPY